MRLDPTRLDWRVIDDAVMGGLSRGRVARAGTSIVFSGTLSTDNNGGFSSIRCALPRPQRRFDTARLRLKGDGRRYQLRLRESDAPDAPAWRAFFDTDGTDQQIVVDARDFQAVIRGRQVEVLPGLQSRAFRFVGLMLTAGDEGPFRLELASLELLSSPCGEAF